MLNSSPVQLRTLYPVFTMILFTGHKGRKLKAGSSRVSGLGRRPDYEQQASDHKRKHQVQQTIIEVLKK